MWNAAPLICCNLAAASALSDETEIYSEPENITVVEKQDGNDRKSVCIRISQLVSSGFRMTVEVEVCSTQTALLDVMMNRKVFLYIIYGSFSVH